MTTTTYDWVAIVDGLNEYLRLRSIPIGMKLFESVEEMEAIPKIRRPASGTLKVSDVESFQLT